MIVGACFLSWLTLCGAVEQVAENTEIINFGCMWWVNSFLINVKLSTMVYSAVKTNIVIMAFGYFNKLSAGFFVKIWFYFHNKSYS